jgi:hypothetical protein
VSSRLLLLLAALGLAGGIARADGGAAGPRHTVAVLDVEASSDDVARSFEGELEAQLGTMRIRFIPRAKVQEQMRESTKWTEGCVVGACLAEVRAQIGADVVLLAALTGSRTTFGYVVTLVRTDTGRVLAQESDRCDVCTESEATTSAILAAVKLVNAIPDRFPDEAAEAGAAVDVAVNAASRRHQAERRGTRRIGWALTLAGVAAASVGTLLYLAADGRPEAALAAAAGGGGLAVGGLAILVF